MAFNPLHPSWPKQAADAIDAVVQKVRSTVTTRAVQATNVVVYGLLVIFAALVAAVLGCVASARAVQVYLTWQLGTPAAWIVGSVALVGVLIALIGLIKSQKLSMLLGAVVLAFGGARWAIHAGDAVIDHDTAVWISYLVVGGLFVVAGSFLMAKRHAPVEK
jgi:hypothetical protein